jgi:hypothetical protein
MQNIEDELIESIPSEEEDKDTGVPIYRIACYPADPTLEVIRDKWSRKEIVIPEFQRGWVWKPVQASRLIESFLLGLPVPSIFLYRESSQKQLVIDGQQRLRTIWGFFIGELPDGKEFYLRGVSPQWEGKTYETLNEEERVRFRDSVLREIIVEQLDPRDKTSIYHIFERLNTGGTALTPQEIRNSTYHGPFNNIIIELNKDPSWRVVFGSPSPDTRMRDIELIVRFLALTIDVETYAKPMKQFLNIFMANHQMETDGKTVRELFLNTVKKVHDSLGSKPFNIRRGINVAVYDSIMVAFARSKNTPLDIKDRYRILLSNPSFLESTSQHTTDVDRVKNRIALAREILFK